MLVSADKFNSMSECIADQVIADLRISNHMCSGVVMIHKSDLHDKILDAVNAAVQALKDQQESVKDKNPMQPIVDTNGVHRFKSNKIVDKLYDYAVLHGYGLNEMALDDFSDDDRQQFAQLIGYSVSGYGTLSYCDEDVYENATIESTGLLK